MSLAKQHNTIFLTSEEAERLRETFRGRLQECQVLAGQPRAPVDPKFSLNKARTASLLSDIASASDFGSKALKGPSDTVVAFAVGRPYMPCTVLLHDLQPIKLSDIRMDTHHRGRVLVVRRVAPVVKLVVFSWTVVQDESTGETERLEVLLHKSKHGQDILELGSTFEIKEPYFTLSDLGDPTLRIDHPSDLVVRKDNFSAHVPVFCYDSIGDPEGAAPSKDTISLAKTAKDFKEDGNTAIGQQAYQLAHANYTQALQMVTTDILADKHLVHDLFRNRSLANLVLNRLDEAKVDAIASLTGLKDQKYKDLDGKAYFRAGCAAYNLGQFEEARSFFEKQQRLMPDHQDVTVGLRKTELRLQEQTTGLYDFKKIKASLSVARPQVDVASFTRNVKVGESPDRGRGLFATRDINFNEIILCEKPFSVVWGHEEEALTVMTYDGRDDRTRVFPAGLCKAIVQKLQSNPSQVENVLDLYGDYKGVSKQLIMRDSAPVIDTFQIHDIVARNAFGPGPVYSGSNYGEGEVNNASAGLWIMASYTNHSCIPNAKKESIGDLMVLRAARPIRAGDEITHSYDSSSDYNERAAALMNTWGFICTCALCIAEKGDSPAMRNERRELEIQANDFIARNEARRAKRLSVFRAKRLARSINNTYDDARYNGLPRIALLRIQKWLAEANT